MANLSRTGILPVAAMALASAAAIPAIAAATENPDARLFELKREFDRIVAERNQIERDNAEGFAEFHRRVEILRETRCGIGILRGIPGYDAAVNRIHDLDQMQDGVMAQMQAQGAKTLAGLAIIATAIKEHDLPSFWRETDEDADWTDLQARRLIDMVIAFATGGANG